MHSSFLLAVAFFAQSAVPAEDALIATIKARTGFVSMDAYYTVFEERYDDGSSCAREGRYVAQGASISIELNRPLERTSVSSKDESLKQLASRLSAQHRAVYDHTRELYQFHNGAWTISHWFFAPTLQTPTVGAEEGEAVINMPDGPLLTPRSLLGEVGRGSSDESAKTRGMLLDEFLSAPGSFELYEEEGCRVLCHQVVFNNGVDEEKLSIDLWLDNEDNLVRIDRTTRPWGISEEVVRASIGKPWREAKSVGSRIELSDFVRIGDALRIPLRGVKTVYGVEKEDMERLNAAQTAEEFSEDERRIRITQLPRNRIISQTSVDIDATRSKFNEPVDENLFIPQFPNGTEIKTDARWQEKRIVANGDEKQAWYRRYDLWVLGLACCLVIAILFPVSRRVFGWDLR